MPKPNYSYEKRQRELEKKRKKEEKAARKVQGPAPAEPANTPPETTKGPAGPSDAGG